MNDVTKKIASKKLADLGIEENAEEKVPSTPFETPSPQYTHTRLNNTRRTKFGSDKDSYRVTSREVYRKNFPTVKTPSVFSKAKVDQELRDVAAKFMLEQGSSDVSMDGKDLEVLMNTLYRYFGDVLEGMDCIILHQKKVQIMNMLRAIVTECCVHHDEQGVNRYIKVDDESKQQDLGLEIPSFLRRNK